MGKDYYKILGIEKDVDDAQVKKAFRKLAHKYHPDKKTGDEAKFKEVNEAYQILGNKEKRTKYDQFGSTFDQQGGFGGGATWEDFMGATRGQGGGMNFGGMDLGDIFGDMFGFGGGRGRQRTARGRDIQVDVSISFEEAIFGVEKEIKLVKNNACDVCTGSGAEPGSDLKTCDTCQGQGKVYQVQRTILGNMQTAVNCQSCQGKGRIPEKTCTHCGGDGAVGGEKTLNVKIPAGIDNGQSIRISGSGEHPGSIGQAGDLFVAVQVSGSKKFSREGVDIYTKAHITFPQAVLGDKISIETLDGDKTLVIPSGTQSQQQFRLKGLGVPYLQGSGRGNQYIDVIVDVPKKPSKKAKKLIKELEEEL